jgi:cellulose biosynthesis protein BcsQ
MALIQTDDLDEDVVLYRKLTVDDARRWSTALPTAAQVTTIGDLKGGVRKTAATMHFAFGLAYEHPSDVVMVGDCDQFGSCESWRRKANRYVERENAKRQEAGQPLLPEWPKNLVVVRATGDDMHESLVASARKYHAARILIDTAPNDRPAIRRALLISGAYVIPTGPGIMDLERLTLNLDLAEEIRQLRGRGFKVKILLTGCKYGTKAFAEAVKFLSRHKMPFFGMPIRDLQGQANNSATVPDNLHDYGLVLPQFEEMHTA